MNDRLVRQLFTDRSAYARGWAVQLAMEMTANEPSPLLIGQFVTMARDDASPVVRLYLASAMQSLPLAQRWSILEGLTSHPTDADDHNLPLMYWYAAELLAEVDATRALALAMSAGESIPLLREFMLRRIGSSDGESSLAVLVDGLSDAKLSTMQLTFLKAIRTSLQGQRKVKAPADWDETGCGRSRTVNWSARPTA